jgi:hypothetical protein
MEGEKAERVDGLKQYSVCFVVFMLRLRQELIAGFIVDVKDVNNILRGFGPSFGICV